MAKDDIFKIIYSILTELYACKKQGCKVNLQDISSKRFGINEGYLFDILCDLLQEGYVKGFSVRVTKGTGRCICGLENINITLKGIEYLQENSTMKKVYEKLKEVKDLIPGL